MWWLQLAAARIPAESIGSMWDQGAGSSMQNSLLPSHFVLRRDLCDEGRRIRISILYIVTSSILNSSNNPLVHYPLFLFTVSVAAVGCKQA